MTTLDAYRQLIAKKAISFEPRGLSRIPVLNSAMFPHQAACTQFALETGCAGIFLSTCEVGLHQIERMQKTLNEHEERIDNLVDKAGDDAEKIEELEEGVEGQFAYVVSDIEEARQYLKAGRISDAMRKLETVLQEVDGACRRATVVAPMLPIAGSF